MDTPSLKKPRRLTGKLSATRLLAAMQARQPLQWSDGNNLSFLVARTGSACWIFRYSSDGRMRKMGLGGCLGIASVSAMEEQLQYMRARALELRVLLTRDGVDPLADKQHNKRQRAKDTLAQIVADNGGIHPESERTFSWCVAEFIKAKTVEFSNPKHRQQWENTLANYAETHFGKKPVHLVSTEDIRAALDPIWTTKNETATRVRGRVEKVLDWAKVAGYRDGENPARWRGHMDLLLAKPSKVQQVEHHAALPYLSIGAFVADLRGQSGVGAKALEFLILTATRTNEGVQATWAEIDWDRQLWTIPAARMKAGKEHVVPLTDAAMAVLRAMGDKDSSGPIFPGQDPTECASLALCSSVLRRMDRKDITVHGFRSTFRDWAGETTAFPREVIEHALAHRLKDKAEAAYQRGSMLEKRRKLMGTWAEYCARARATDSQNVVSLAA